MSNTAKIKDAAKLLMAGVIGILPNFSLENTNIPGYEEMHQATDYNRLRGDLTLEHETYTNWLGELIIDNETLYTTRPDNLENTTSIYRAYLQYRGVKHFWSVGKQRIPLGVGRIWNPIDLFNPIDSQAIETDEREGTESIRYEYSISDLSNIDSTIAEGKGEVRIKGYLEYADVGLIGLWDEDENLNVIGWELEGQLLQTGLELRSEGGSFHNRDTGDRHTEFIVGGEYGFVNSLALLAEYKYSDATGVDYIGTQIRYQPALLWFFNILAVINLDDTSNFIAPHIEYSLSDEMTLSAGAFIYSGNSDDEFGQLPNHYYLRWFAHF